jgi:hypothetical protein
MAMDSGDRIQNTGKGRCNDTWKAVIRSDNQSGHLTEDGSPARKSRDQTAMEVVIEKRVQKGMDRNGKRMGNSNETGIEAVTESDLVLMNEHLGFRVYKRDTLL